MILQIDGEARPRQRYVPPQVASKKVVVADLFTDPSGGTGGDGFGGFRRPLPKK